MASVKGVNKVILIGNLGKDPETRFLPSGTALTTFAVAVSETWKDKQTGEINERTEWIDIETWGFTAEACGKYLTKGKQVYVEGSLKTDSWDDPDTKQKKYRTKVRANNVQFLGGAKDDRAPQNSSPAAPPASGNFDDDIPF